VTLRKPATGSDLFLTSCSPQPALRIGVVVDGDVLPLWQRSVVELVQATNYADVVYVLVGGAPRGRIQDRSWRSVLFRLYSRLDRQLYGSRRAPDPDRLVPSRELLNALPGATLHTAQGPDTGERRLTGAEAADLPDLDLDVLIDLGSGGPDPRLMAVPRHGVFRCHFGAGADGGEAHAGFPELAGPTPLTTVSLRRVAAGSPAGEVLATATISTVAGVSWALNRFEPLWLATELIVQTLHRLHQSGPGALDPVPLAPAGNAPASGLRPPGNIETVRFLATALARKARRRLRHPSADLVPEWRLAIRPVAPETGGIPVLHDAGGFRWLESPPGRHWADPFILERHGRHWLFFEEYLYAEGRGVIVAASLDEEGRPGPVHRILDSGGHLSYPFVFEDGDDVYLLPESADRRSATLYRATDFPHAWEPVATLGDGLQLLDTTLLQEGGLYWTFTSVPGRHRAGYTVLLFWAESLDGPWHPHPASPISRDIRYARGAGRIFRAGGRLFRPVQDGAGGYGRKVHFFEILELTRDVFRERLSGTLAPVSLPDAPPRLEGIHTYNRSGRFEVIDGVRLERRPGLRRQR
jgi:hypothetical protein